MIIFRNTILVGSTIVITNDS